MVATLIVQRALRSAGHDPGPLDGAYGRRTIAAIRAFQRAGGLPVDGIAGPATLERLLPPTLMAATAPSAVRPPWYAEALRLKGLREEAGARDNPLILGWARRLRLPYRHDATPWCGLFAAHCLAATLPDEPLPANPLGARNWLRFGRSCGPALGAVAVFRRGAARGPYGHVGFYAGADAAAIHVLGGNQADAVSIARIARDRLLGLRWPASGGKPPEAGQALAAATDTGLSTDEG